MKLRYVTAVIACIAFGMLLAYWYHLMTLAVRP